MNQADIKYPDVRVRLVGEDGNAYAIMGRVQSALQDAGISNKECEKYIKEATSGDYDNLLRVTMSWVTTDSEDEDEDDYTDYHDQDNGDH
jgi:hypothetical protein